MKRRSLLLGLLLPLLLPNAAHAGPEEVANQISSEIMSPFCPGVTLHECPSAKARELRDRIERWLRDGWSRERVMARLEADYGPSIRARPRAEGTGIWAWALPIAAVVVAAGLAAYLAGRWTRSSRAQRAQGSPLTPAQRERVDTELASLRTGER